jgi:putative drug exporter of the RND superfamily
VLAGLACLVHRHRTPVFVVWVLLTLFGAFAAKQVSKRWFESFSIPGYSAYETNQKALHTFGTGEQAPLVAVFHSAGDVTKARGIGAAIRKAQQANPGSRVSS